MIVTDRLILRRWRDADRAAFAALNADAEVMQYFPATLDRAQSDALADQIESHFETHGFGMWAMERRNDGAFIGFTGLNIVKFASPIENDVEIGWRFARDCWGLGLGPEAATAALTNAWTHDIARIVSMTVAANRRSWWLMERLGLLRRHDLDFDHPRLSAGHPLRPHIVYALDRP